MRPREELPDLRCYLVTSGTGRRTVEIAAEAAAAGAGIVQVRGKELATAELMELARAVGRAVAAASPTTAVVVDDRADVAWALAREHEPISGVHLGQDDLPVAAARALLGPEALIGLTTGTLELVRRAAEVEDLVDYLGAGPFRPTPTKDSGRPALGIDGYRPLVAATRLPVVAIGDVTPADVPALAATGIAGTALVRAVMGAEAPGAAVRQVLTGWDGTAGRPGSVLR